MKTFGKILLWCLLAFFAAALIAAAVIGIKYYRVTHSDAKVELVSGPALDKALQPELGAKRTIITLFRLPWGVRPLSLTVQPAPGSQLVGQPGFRLVKRGWGSDLWQGNFLLQSYREGDIKEASAQAVFSNKQTFDLKVPPMQVSPPVMHGEHPLELAGEMQLPQKNHGKNILLWIAAGVLVLVVIILIVLRFLRRERQRIVPPWESALAAIRALLDNVRDGSAAPERSIARLTDIVREYMERRFRLRAERQTTAEFMSDLESGKGSLVDRHREFLREFLTAADMVKFARVPADKTIFENAAHKAEELIRETAPSEAGKENEK